LTEKPSCEAEEARSGYEAADWAQELSLNTLSNAAAELSMTPASTVDGMFAKARAFGLFTYVENLAQIIKEQIDETTAIGREVVVLSLARDMFAVSGSGLTRDEEART
jgi:hypothetical protein